MKSLWSKICVSALVAVASASAAASVLGLEALGSDNFVGNGADLGRGYTGHSRTQEGVSLLNPARLAFDRKTSFMVSLDYQGFYQNSEHLGRDGIKLSSFAAGFPLGSWGALGLGMWERYTNEFSLQGAVGADTFNLNYSGSLTELAPSYAFRFPGFLQGVALGVAWHVPTGHITRSIERVPANTAAADQFWQSGLLVNDESRASWEMSGSNPGYLGLAGQYFHRRWSLYVGYSQAYKLNRSVAVRQSVSIIDTTAASVFLQEINFPQQISTGFNYSLSEWFSISADFQSQYWDAQALPTLAGLGMKESYLSTKQQNFYGLGLQKEGSSKFYESFIARSSFRVGGWYRDWYLNDVHEFAGSLGMGMPLGKRGAKLDLGFAGGYREAPQQQDEWFWSLGMSFTGFAEWGKSSRRSR